jgi:hypothetical protein
MDSNPGVSDKKSVSRVDPVGTMPTQRFPTRAAIERRASRAACGPGQINRHRTAPERTTPFHGDVPPDAGLPAPVLMRLVDLNAALDQHVRVGGST